MSIPKRRRDEDELDEIRESVREGLREEEIRNAVSEDAMERLGAGIYNFRDPTLEAFIAKFMPALMPATTYLNRLSNISEKEKTLYRLRFQAVLLEQLLNLQPEHYEQGVQLFLSALEHYGWVMANDNLMGFKQRSLNEQIKRIEVPQQQRRRGFWIFR